MKELILPCHDLQNFRVHLRWCAERLGVAVYNVNGSYGKASPGAVFPFACLQTSLTAAGLDNFRARLKRGWHEGSPFRFEIPGAPLKLACGSDSNLNGDKGVCVGFQCELAVWTWASIGSDEVQSMLEFLGRLQGRATAHCSGKERPCFGL